MARASSTFRQQDLIRAIRAVVAAGVGIARVEVDRAGKISIIALGAEPASEGGKGPNEWDTVLRYDKN